VSKVFAITNQKGGVGKTTTTVNLAASLAATRRRVLLIDLDPQGNATMGSGIDKYALDYSIYDVLVGDATASDVRMLGTSGGYDLLPANADLTAAEVTLISLASREYRLKNALATIVEDYDYVFIDCPPSLNMLTVNALTAADAVLIPVQCEYYALEGLASLIQTIEDVKRLLNPRLAIEGLLRTMYDPRNSLTRDVSAELQTHFGEQLYRTTIPRNVRLAEAPSFGTPVLQHDRQSSGALAYLALAGEILNRYETSENDSRRQTEHPDL
jgi:chromosome partitioning protein